MPNLCSTPAELHKVSAGLAETAGGSILPGAKSWTELGADVLFEKVLTSSDINPQGRIVVPKVPPA